MGKRYNVKDCIRRGVRKNSPYNLVERSRISLTMRIQSGNVQKSTILGTHFIEILINSIENYDAKREMSRCKGFLWNH
jgi:hypothetical protein